MAHKCSALNCMSGYSGETKDPKITDILTTDLSLTELRLVTAETFYNVDIQFFCVTKRLNQRFVGILLNTVL